MTNRTACPACNENFVGDEIPVGLMETGHYATWADACKAAESYGWTKENKRTFVINSVYHTEYIAKGNDKYFYKVKYDKCSTCGYEFDVHSRDPKAISEFFNIRDKAAVA